MKQLVFIDNEGITDPHINLAIEEYALRYFDPQYTYLLFYVNEPSIIIGRNQNTLEEINYSYVREKGIHVVRRLSGGGAVYHDAGNLNFSFITDHGADRLHNFELFTGPVIRVLNEMGVEAVSGGRNDITVDGRKISGNAQYSTTKRMFSHGTLLLNSDLSEVTRALNVRMSKFQSKGLKSARARVANIAEYAEHEMDVRAFRQQLIDGIFRNDALRLRRLTPAEWEGVRKLIERRYGNDTWNYGGGPAFDLRRTRRFDFGEVSLHLEVKKGLIDEIRITGDFLGVTGSVREIEDRLRGLRYEYEVVERALEGINMRAYFGNGSDGAILNLLFGPDL